MKEDAVYLRHILERIRRIEENASGGHDRFMASHTLQDAALRNLQTMTESIRYLSDASKATRPEIEWQHIAAFRNVLVHDYLGVDLGKVWEVIQRDVPPLKSAVSAMLETLERKR